MGRIFFIAVTVLLVFNAAGQTLSLNEMVNLTTYNTSKFNSFISKKGFRIQEGGENSIKYSYLNKKGDDTIEHTITRVVSDHKESLSFNNLTKRDITALQQKLQQEGYAAGSVKGKEDTMVYQKENLTFYIREDTDSLSNTPFYQVLLENAILPKPKDIFFAEDLLAYNSHEQLVAAFGAKNVVKDVFVAADGKERVCSVLMPYTSNEAVFLWNDEQNYRKVRSIRIGGFSQTKSAMNYNRPVVQNYWRSNQGIFIGMSLKELDGINGNEIEFYGWDWDSGGTLASNNNGKINFKKISLLLSCLNCTDSNYQKNKVTSSTTAMEEDKKIHIATMIILP